MSEQSTVEPVAWSDDAYGGFGQRLAALLIDGLILSAVGAVLVGILLAILAATDRSGFAILLLVIGYIAFIVGAALYDILLTSRRGATVGKKVMGLEVRTAQGTIPGTGLATGRYFARGFISGAVFALGYLWALWDPQRRTWHDMICSTFVVQRDRVRAAAGGPPGPALAAGAGAYTAGWGQPQPYGEQQWGQPQQQWGQSPQQGGQPQQQWGQPQPQAQSGQQQWGQQGQQQWGSPAQAWQAPAESPTALAGDFPSPFQSPPAEAATGGAHDLNDPPASQTRDGPGADVAGDRFDPSSTVTFGAPGSTPGAPASPEPPGGSPLEAPASGAAAPSAHGGDPEPRDPPAGAEPQSEPFTVTGASADPDAYEPWQAEPASPAGPPGGGTAAAGDEPVAERAGPPAAAAPAASPGAPSGPDMNLVAVDRAGISPDSAGWLRQVAEQVGPRLDRINPDWRSSPQAEAASACAFGLLLGHLASSYPHMRADLDRVAESHPSFSTLLAGSRLETLRDIAAEPARVGAWLGPLIDVSDADRVRRLLD